MKQTATEWLFQKLWDEPKDKLTWYGILKQAKRMEKEQIIQTYHKSALNEATHIIGGTSHISAEQYYNETFNTKEK